MRGPSTWAVAVRKPDGEIAQVTQTIESPMKRHPIARLPVIRGVVALGESLAIGFKALAISANYAAQEEGESDEEVPTELSRMQLFFAFAVAIGFAIALFLATGVLATGPVLAQAKIGVLGSASGLVLALVAARLLKIGRLAH